MARVSTSSINAGIYLQADWTQTNKYYSAQATYFAFDTSSIPADATITGAKLKLYGYAGYKASLLGKADLVVVESLQLGNSTLATSDWTRMGSEVFGRIGYDSFSDSSFNDISLATSSIVVGGTTKLCAFLDWFIEGYDGGWSGGGYTQYVIYLADEAGTSKDPVLEVTYTTEDVSYEEENPVGEIVNEFGLPVILRGNAGKKQYYYKIYNQGSTLWDVNKWDTDNWDYSVDYMTTWTEDVLSIPSFTTDINGGAGAMYVRLKRDITEFGEGSDVDLFNKVDVYVSAWEIVASESLLELHLVLLPHLLVLLVPAYHRVDDHLLGLSVTDSIIVVRPFLLLVVDHLRDPVRAIFLTDLNHRSVQVEPALELLQVSHILILVLCVSIANKTQP
jgi:hypothetical protein